jgi:hypothetical protein
VLQGAAQFGKGRGTVVKRWELTANKAGHGGAGIPIDDAANLTGGPDTVTGQRAVRPQQFLLTVADVFVNADLNIESIIFCLSDAMLHGNLSR